MRLEESTAARHDRVHAEYRDPEYLGRGSCSSVTVVICTFVRPEPLLRLLASIEKWEGSKYSVLVVDASPDRRTESAVMESCESGRTQLPLSFYRVSDGLKGLTRQRNFALSIVDTELVCYFDDDVVLISPCVTEMESAYRCGTGKAGVGALIVNQSRTPSLLWKTRRWLGIVGTLRPGSYQGSGMSVPWGYVRDSDRLVEGDWLPGAAMLWNTTLAREAGFCEKFNGYSLSEDLEFSLRLRKKGSLVLCPQARVLHLESTDGREESYRLGYMAVYNRYQIHRHNFPHHRVMYAPWFAYAWVVDSLMLVRNCTSPRRAAATGRHLAGRLRAAFDVLCGIAGGDRP